MNDQIAPPLYPKWADRLFWFIFAGTMAYCTVMSVLCSGSRCSSFYAMIEPVVAHLTPYIPGQIAEIEQLEKLGDKNIAYYRSVLPITWIINSFFLLGLGALYKEIGQSARKMTNASNELMNNSKAAVLPYALGVVPVFLYFTTQTIHEGELWSVHQYNADLLMRAGATPLSLYCLVIVLSLLFVKE